MACCRLQPARYFTKALCTRHRSHTLILKSLRRIFSFRILSLSSFFAWIRFCCSAKRAEMFLSRAIIASSSRSSSLSSSPFCFSECKSYMSLHGLQKQLPALPCLGLPWLCRKRRTMATSGQIHSGDVATSRPKTATWGRKTDAQTNEKRSSYFLLGNPGRIVPTLRARGLGEERGLGFGH